MKKAVLQVENLTKDFDGFLAVDDISFEIEEGEIFGFLGPNGAGKTTTIMMLLGLTKPTKGKIKIFGMDLEQNREKILNRVNFSSAYTFLPSRLTVFENLYVFACLYQIFNPRHKIEELLENFELTQLKNRATGNLSSGEMTRLNLCKALLNDPELLFLDEPTSSLDPDIAQKTRELLFRIKRERNISILFTSHNMQEVTQMCDRVVFIDRGKIVASGTPLNLTKQIKECVLTLVFDAPLEKVKKFFQRKRLAFQIPQFNVAEIKTKEQDISKLLTELTKARVSIVDVSVKKPDLEDVFIKITRSAGKKI
jgi:ABC-2 type transport system ATP-binding protein